MPEAMAEGYPSSIPSPPPVQSMQEKLQEVDFYIRLGFHNEALTKLNEIAKIDPHNPDLPSRPSRFGFRSIAKSGQVVTQRERILALLGSK